MTREEAIEVVKERLDYYEREKRLKKACEILIPELAESEDERIRKHLIEIVEIYWGTTNEPGKAADLAWLEKQKEPHYTKRNALFDKCVENCDPAVMKKVSDEVDKMLEKERKSVEYLDKDKVYAIMTKLTNLSYSTRIPINSDEYKKLNEITKDVRDLLDYPIEQKPADYNEYKMLIEGARENGKIEGRKEVIDHPEEYGLTWQKPAEWSEEDEDMLNSCISSIEEAKENRYAYKETDGDTSYDHEIAWLKSLRPVSKESLQSWKPSEEQMKALSDACCIAFVEERYFHPSLSRLYHDLKKL